MSIFEHKELTHEIKETLQERLPVIIAGCLSIITAIFILYFLRELKALFVPVVFSVFLALLFQPTIISMYKKFKIPKVLSILFLVSITCFLIFVFGLIAVKNLRQFQASISNIIVPKLDFITTKVLNDLNIASDLRPEISFTWFFNEHREKLSSLLFDITSFSLTLASNIFLVLVFTVFLLLEFRNFSYKIQTSFSENISDRWKEVGINITKSISHYLWVKTIISLITGILIYISLSIIGVPFAKMWGVIGFTLNFIPTIGSALVVILTILMSVVHFFPEYPPIIATVASMLAIQLVMGQIIDPRMQGKSLDISPFLILVSLVIWGWVWGIPGMFLSVPMTVLLKLIFTKFGPFKSIAKLMSEGVPPNSFEDGDDDNFFTILVNKIKPKKDK